MNTTLKRIALTSFVALLGAHAGGCLERPIGLIEPVKAGSYDEDEPTRDLHFCVEDSDCEEGYSCWANCCEPDFTPSGSSSTGSGGGSEDLCAALLPNETVMPTIVVLADRSGSMNDALNEDENHWQALHSALTDADEGVIPSMQDRASFGVADYTCKQHENELDLSDVAWGDAIASEYDADATMGNYTPTGDALQQLAERLDADDSDEPKLILLATDGEPNICKDNDRELGQERAVEAAEAAFAMNIKTVVLAVGDGFSQDHLEELANAGAGVAAGDPAQAMAYRAEEKGELLDHLYAIVAAEQACVIKLDRPMSADAAFDSSITLDGESIAHSPENGWTLRDESHIELHGEACRAVQEDYAEIAGNLCAR